MKRTIGIIGGDLRIIKLAQIFAKDNYFVYTYAIDKNIFKEENIIKCNSIKEVCCNCTNIIGGVPFSKDGKYIDTPFSYEKIEINSFFKDINGKTLLAGGINNVIEENGIKEKVEIIDLLKIEELTVLNVIPTVEGAVDVAINNTEVTLNNSKCLILGFGRIGKLLSSILKAFGADISCTARKQSDLAWMRAYGYKQIHLNDLDFNLNNKYDIIFNTVPHVLLDEKRLRKIKEYNPVIIELASKPYGIDFETAKRLGINVIKASGLPGKIAPQTSAENIKNVIEKRL